MDYSIEQHFVQAFIRKSRRERLLHELTTPGKRHAGIDRFCHQAKAMIDPDRIVMEGEDLERRPEFERFVCEHDGLCYMLSNDFYTGEKFVPLEEAVGLAVMCPDTVLILGSGFAVVFGEPMKGGRGKFLLAEEKPAR
ncbi:MAG: hypothetical protein IK082_11995 [Oscillospiraceae bacterium]|nr:hypothetical protein [Oscillospiraceae bacterium]